MARLSNDRHELYARHRAKGMIPSKAALAAGFAAGSSTTHLEQDAEIVTRIAELMDEIKAQREAQRHAAIEAAKVVGQLTGVTRSWVIQQLAEVAQIAKQDGDYKESISALELIGKDFGMFSGGSSDEGANAIPESFDMDKLAGILDAAHDALPAPALDESRDFGADTAMRLIEGQMPVRVETERATPDADPAVLLAEALPEEEPQTEAEAQDERDDFDRLRAELDDEE